MNQVEEFYDKKFDEWNRFDTSKIEFDITKLYMDKYINNNKSIKIIDIGGGPGRYSFYLAQKGHHVTLVDLSSRNISVAKEKAVQLGIVITSYTLDRSCDTFIVYMLRNSLKLRIKEYLYNRKLQMNGSLIGSV